MVTIRFKPMEVQELLLWGKHHKDRQTETGMKWDDEQQRIIDKLNKVKV